MTKFITLTLIVQEEEATLQVNVNPKHISAFYMQDENLYVQIDGRNVFMIAESIEWLAAELAAL